MTRPIPEELRAELVDTGLADARIAFIAGTVEEIVRALQIAPPATMTVAVICEDTTDDLQRLLGTGVLDVVFWPTDRPRIRIRAATWRRMIELEDARERSENRVRFLYDKTPAMLHSIDDSGRLISVSDTWLSRLGYTREEVIGKRSSDFLVIESRRLAVDLIIPAFLRTGRMENIEYQFRAKDGSVVDVLMSAVAEKDADGRVVRSVAISSDVSGERRLAERLVDADALLSNILDNVPDPLFVKDADHRWIALNQSFCDFMGRRADELLGHSDFDFFPHEEAAVFRAKDEAVFASGQTNENEEVFTDAQGARHVIATKKAMFTDARGHKVLVGIIRDLTDRKQLEAQLSLTERMASVGTLAAGVAHEINNPLAYVIGNIEFAREAISDLPTNISVDVVESLAEAAEGASRICDIVRDMKTFSRVDPDHLGSASVSEAVHLAVRMLANQLRHIATVAIDLPEVAAVQADESRLGQVLVNLVMNAMQAFTSPSLDSKIGISVSQAGEEVTITVRDNGCGIAPEVLGRIFDPFFTTKPVGVGTGLGLSICHGIVSALGGRIEIESTLGAGTVARVMLRTWQTMATAPTAITLPVVAMTARSKILIVEDDLFVAKSFQRNLAREFDVTTYQDARLALAEIKSGTYFDLLLCDVMMPIMNGIAFYEQLRAFDPKLLPKFAFVTGGTFTEDARRFLDATTVPRLYKPASPSELLAFVRDVLGGPRGDAGA